MHTKTLKQLSGLLHSKQVSATELAAHYLARAKSSDLNAFLHIDESLTMAQAAAADARLAGGSAGPLTGVPIAHKDIFVTRGWRSTAGSKMLGNYTSPFDATVVQPSHAAGLANLADLDELDEVYGGPEAYLVSHAGLDAGHLARLRTLLLGV